MFQSFKVKKILRNLEHTLKNHWRSFRDVEEGNWIDCRDFFLDENGQKKSFVFCDCKVGEYRELGIIVDIPSFNVFLIISESGIWSTINKEKEEKISKREIPFFIRDYIQKWVIENQEILKFEASQITLQKYKELWGDDFVETTKVDETTLY